MLNCIWTNINEIAAFLVVLSIIVPVIIFSARWVKSKMVKEFTKIHEEFAKISEEFTKVHAETAKTHTRLDKLNTRLYGVECCLGLGRTEMVE